MNRGFTLLEILITIIVLTVGVVALSRAFSAGLFASKDAEDVGLALNIAQAKMEEIKAKTFSEIAKEGDSGPKADSDFPDFDFAVDVDEAEEGDLMRVDVTVSWGRKGGEESVTLTTLVADY